MNFNKGGKECLNGPPPITARFAVTYKHLTVDFEAHTAYDAFKAAQQSSFSLFREPDCNFGTCQIRML